MKSLLFVTSDSSGEHPVRVDESAREAAVARTDITQTIHRYVLEGSAEHAESLPKEGYFGTFFDLMKASVSVGGSEFGLGMTLFSLVVSTRAATIVETGRFKGFSALALAGGLKFLDECKQIEPAEFQQRPDVNYEEWEAPKKRKLYSIDIAPTDDAENLIKRAGLDTYVERLNGPSVKVPLPEGTVFDLAFIDGDHGYEACEADINRFTEMLRPGGLFILHDYFGWYHQGRNMSPIKQVADKISMNRFKQHVLIDTGYPSLMVFRKPNPKTDTQ
jgi:predicted O-methyltransferase YrrM